MSTARIESVEIASSGRSLSVPAVRIEDRLVVARGARLKIASIMDEEWIEGEGVTDPASFVRELQASGLKADIFTFAQKMPNTERHYAYKTEWDNIAALPIKSVPEWLETQVTYDVRKAVKRSGRRGVTARMIDFDDDFVAGIKKIYDESPTRQGRKFWHYGKDLETLKREHSTYLDRCFFVGAYLEDELVGFIRMVRVGNYLATLQVISMMKYFEKKPVNALLVKAIEFCHEQGFSHLVYGEYVYNDPDSTLTEFKRRNGFQKILLPRYYVPLTLKGRIALGLGLHHRLADRIPLWLRRPLKKLQGRINDWRTKDTKSVNKTEE